MKIKKILLTDDTDEFYTDLVVFTRETTREEIQEAINKCINDKPYDYTNEDIYDYLDKYIGVYSIEFLDYERFYY